MQYMKKRYEIDIMVMEGNGRKINIVAEPAPYIELL